MWMPSSVAIVSSKPTDPGGHARSQSPPHDRVFGESRCCTETVSAAACNVRTTGRLIAETALTPAPRPLPKESLHPGSDPTMQCDDREVTEARRQPPPRHWRRKGRPRLLRPAAAAVRRAMRRPHLKPSLDPSDAILTESRPIVAQHRQVVPSKVVRLKGVGVNRESSRLYREGLPGHASRTKATLLRMRCVSLVVQTTMRKRIAGHHPDHERLHVIVVPGNRLGKPIDNDLVVSLQLAA